MVGRVDFRDGDWTGGRVGIIPFAECDRGKEHAMLRYFLYLSATKIDMLYPQIPPAFFDGAEAELKVNLGVISTGVKSRSPDRPTELSARASAIESHLSSEKVIGTIDKPRSWIKGNCPMLWGVVEEYASDIAFFGGKTEETTVALLGARDSIIGQPIVAESKHDPFYYTLKFFNHLVANAASAKPDDHTRSNAFGDDPPYCSYKEAVNIATKALDSPGQIMQNLEFLALVLHHQENLIVGTPLYVALMMK